MKIYNPTGFSSSLTGSFSGSVKGTLTATGNIIPDVSGAYDIGSTAFPFKDLYITQNSLKFIDDSTGSEIGRISVNSNTGDIKLLNTKNLTEEQKATLTAENVGAEALSPVSASAIWVSQSISPGHERTSIGHTNQKFHTVHTQYVSASSTAISGDLTVGGKVTAQEFHTEFVSASILYESGSTQFGNSGDDIHIFTGNVGIGTSSPGKKLHIVETNNTTYSVSNTTGGGVIGYFRNASTTNSTDATIRLDALGSLSAAVSTITGLHTGDGTSALTFGTRPNNSSDPIERMRIDSSGNVGIGSNSPSQKLNVIGNARIDNSAAGDSLIFFGDNPDWYLAYQQSTSHSYWRVTGDHFIEGASGYKGKWDSNGNLGVGTTSPDSLLTVAGRVNVGEDLYLSRTNAEYGYITRPNVTGYKKAGFVVSGGGSLTDFLVNSDTSYFTGNLGVGTTSPQAKLDVNGVIIARDEVIVSKAPSDTVGEGPNIYLAGNTGSSYTQLSQGVGRFTVWGFSGGWGEKMTIRHSDGAMGIGTTSPNSWSKLDINGSTSSRGNITLYNGQSYRFNNYYNSGTVTDRTITTGYAAAIAFNTGTGTLNFLNSSLSATAGNDISLSEKMTLDSAGRLLKPNTPAFKAIWLVASPTAYSTGGRVLDFTNVLYNIGSHYDGTNKFTAPVAGRYLITTRRALNVLGPSKTVRHPVVRILVNGTLTGGEYSISMSSASDLATNTYAHSGDTVTTILNLSANDYVQVYFAYNNDYATLYEYGTNTFEGYLLG